MRPIDADSIHYTRVLSQQGLNMELAAKVVIDDMPTIDAVPVVHGQWVWADDGYCRCSNCTQKAPVMTQYQDEPTTTMTDYCPSCGAKMDGGAQHGSD